MLMVQQSEITGVNVNMARGVKGQPSTETVVFNVTVIYGGSCLQHETEAPYRKGIIKKTGGFPPVNH